MSDFIPGPWSIYPQPIADAEEAKRELCTLADGTPDYPRVLYMLEANGYAPAVSMHKATAHLIAAAPDLLNALTFLLDHYTEMIRSGDCGNWDPETDSPVIQAREVITKARGTP